MAATTQLLVSERDLGQIVDVVPNGAKQTVAMVPGSESFDPDTPCLELFAYLTTDPDNRIVRMPLLGESGSL